MTYFANESYFYQCCDLYDYNISIIPVTQFIIIELFKFLLASIFRFFYPSARDPFVNFTVCHNRVRTVWFFKLKR